jgi:hypothetical protein
MLSELVKQVLRKAKRVQKNYIFYLRNMKNSHIQRTIEMSDILDDKTLQLKSLELKLGAHDLQRKRKNDNIYANNTITNIIPTNSNIHNININNICEDDLNIPIIIKPKIPENVEELISESMNEEDEIDDVNQDPNDIRNTIILKYKTISRRLAEQIGTERKSSLNSLTILKKQLLLHQTEIEKLRKEILIKEKKNRDQSDQLIVYSLKHKH